MSLRHVWKLAFAAPIVLVLAAILGCPPASTDTGSGSGTESEATTPETKPVLVVAKKGDKGKIKGKVTLSGSPKLDELQAKYKERIQKDSGPDTAHCSKGDTEYPSLVTKDGGVGNVVVWVMPGQTRNDHFDMEESYVKEIVAKRKEAKANEVDQPFCAFKPHVLTMFTDWYNAKTKKIEPTGEKLIVKNSAPIAHNTKGGPANDAPKMNRLIPPGDSVEETLKASNLKPWIINCNVHGFMNGFIWALEHPFVAVTNEKGEFEIDNVPTGQDLYIVAWHELGKDGSMGFFPKGKEKGEKIKLEDDKPLEHNLTLTIK